MYLCTRCNKRAKREKKNVPPRPSSAVCCMCKRITGKIRCSVLAGSAGRNMRTHGPSPQVSSIYIRLKEPHGPTAHPVSARHFAPSVCNNHNIRFRLRPSGGTLEHNRVPGLLHQRRKATVQRLSGMHQQQRHYYPVNIEVL